MGVLLVAASAASLPQYSPGSIERAWDDVQQERACEYVQRDAFSNATQSWLTFARSVHALGSSPLPPVIDPAVAPLLSRLTWPSHGKGGGSNSGGAGDECTELLEPLTGMARHPRASATGCWLRRAPAAMREVASMSQVSKYSIDHIIFASRCAVTSEVGGSCSVLAGRRFRARGSRPQRNLLFDLGCAAYGKPMAKVNTMGGGIQPSLPLLEAIYRRGCVTFDAIWAWEARPHDPKAWWKHVPNATRNVLTFANRPVTHEEFFGTLTREATRDDFVALKLDIDSPGLELAMVRAIADRPEYYHLIDELMFEFHVNLRKLGNATKAAALAALNGMANSTVREALDLMQLLRQRGIRSHFWV